MRGLGSGLVGEERRAVSRGLRSVVWRSVGVSGIGLGVWGACLRMAGWGGGIGALRSFSGVFDRPILEDSSRRIVLRLLVGSRIS